MILENKNVIAEIILNQVLNKSNLEICKFIEDHIDGKVFQYLYNDKRAYGNDNINKFFDKLVDESRKRLNPLSTEELHDFLLQQTEELGLKDNFKETLFKIKSADYSCYDIENTVKPTLLEATKYVKTYYEILLNLDDKSTMDSFCSTMFNKLSRINNIDFKKKSTELSMNNFDEIMDIFADKTQQFLSTGYDSLDNLLAGRNT